MQKAAIIYLLTGSNIEPRKTFLEQACEMIGTRIGHISGRSSVYESPPWGFEANTSFLNQVLRVNTFIEAGEVLNAILEIEKAMGRKRSGERYTSRTIDIDILYYNDAVMDTGSLIIPHPRIRERRFVLEPLAEIAPGFIHPVFMKSNRELLKACPDHSEITIYKKEHAL